MSVPVLTFFNNKGGVGKTTLVYHLSWMFSELGVRTLVVDADPQANVTAAFLDEDSLLEMWDTDDVGVGEARTIYEAVKPLTKIGDYDPPRVQRITPNLGLIVGDLGLSAFEDQLSEQWTKSLGDDTRERAMLVLSAFWRLAQRKAMEMRADLIIFDVGPNLGAINRSVLIGTDFVVVPLAADLYSLQGLRNLGPALLKWRSGWAERREKIGDAVGVLPNGQSRPIGYVALQHQERLSRPVQAYVSWLERIPTEYRQHLLQSTGVKRVPPIQEDPFCLAMLRHYKSLIPFAQEARKPVFKLRSADGAIGSHAAAVTRAYEDFSMLAKKVLKQMNIKEKRPT